MRSSGEFWGEYRGCSATAVVCKLIVSRVSGGDMNSSSNFVPGTWDGVRYFGRGHLFFPAPGMSRFLEEA